MAANNFPPNPFQTGGMNQEILSAPAPAPIPVAAAPTPMTQAQPQPAMYGTGGVGAGQFEIDATPTFSLPSAAAAATPTVVSDPFPPPPPNGGVFTGSGALDNGGAASSSNDNNNNNNANGGWFSSMQRCFTVEGYREYFNVDTEDVQKRVVGSVRSCNTHDEFRLHILGGIHKPEDENVKRPDLYGPVWITMTLVFFVAVTSNISQYIEKEDFDYDISRLLHAFTILSGFAVLWPLLLYLGLKCVVGVSELPLVHLWSLYGYALVPYLPASLICLIPFSFVAWLALLAATAVSCLLILRNVATPLLELESTGGGGGGGGGLGRSMAGPVLIGVIVIHFALFFVLKLTFY